MSENIMELFDRTMKNCKFYEGQNDTKGLLNEIGVLRGIAYCMESIGICPHSPDFTHFIDRQNELKNLSLPPRDRAAFDLVNAMLAYAAETNLDEWDTIRTLDDIGITFDDFVHSGNGNYGTAREFYEV